eukprot:gene21248-28167_t
MPQQVSKITIQTFCAGDVGPDKCKRMAESASQLMRKGLQEAPKSEPSSSSSPSSSHLGSSWRMECLEPVLESRGSAMGSGSGLLITAETSTGCLFGASARIGRGVSPEEAGRSAAEELLEVLLTGACVDGWMQDQLIVFMALASGESSIVCSEPSLHTRTAIEIAQALLPQCKFDISLLGKDQPLWLITCKGAGVAPACSRPVSSVLRQSSVRGPRSSVPEEGGPTNLPRTDCCVFRRHEAD